MKIKKSLLSAFTVFGLSIAALGMVGCASGARTTQMVASPSMAPIVTGEAGYKQFKVVKVQGGSKTNPLWMSNVSDEDFQAALETSLLGANYLADEANNATAEITASMVELKRPLAGLDLSVTTRVRYSVVETKGGTVLFDDTVGATGTAKFGDALIAVERLRIANEAAIKANIEAFIERLRETLKAKPTTTAAAQ